MAIKKLALTINAFDASELLEDLISEIRDQVDHVAAIYQKKSYWNNPMAEEDMEELLRLQKLDLIDELIEFKPNFTKYSREQECDKRNMGIDLMKQNGSSHILNIDADEFYDADQFEYAIDVIEKRGYTITYWSYVNYYRDFSHYLVYPFRPLVPGIHSTFFKYTYQGPAPGPTDPTRRINNPHNLGTYVFEDNEIRMGHAAWIRRDIRKKLVNWSAKNHFKPELIDEAVNRWENWKEGDKAIMLFNTPENQVRVNKLETKIHKFDVPWLKEKGDL
ncbi:MAG TPA: hypothetical protein VMZ29_08600 [Candidatus Bathyarchaeia archaeon]|nr:hypothetical protein [Candidatus Bathyarchaeia archaeon]